MPLHERVEGIVDAYLEAVDDEAPVVLDDGLDRGAELANRAVRQHQMREPTATGDRQEVELHGEQHDEHRTEPKGRHGLAEERDEHAEQIGEPILAERGQDPRPDVSMSRMCPWRRGFDKCLDVETKSVAARRLREHDERPPRAVGLDVVDPEAVLPAAHPRLLHDHHALDPRLRQRGHEAREFDGRLVQQ